MSLYAIALSVVAAVGLSGGIAGWDQGWAFAEQELSPPGKWGPPAKVELQLGWWNSTTAMKSGWGPGFEISGEGARGLGAVTAGALALGVAVAAYVLLVALSDVLSFSLPTQIRTTPDNKYKLAGLFGVLSLVLSVALYLVLLVGAHNKVKDKFGDDASVWPRPDWAAGCALLGALSLLGVAHQLAPPGTPVGYLPI